MESETFEGTVKWFNAERGFGVIEPSADGPDLFVHYSALPSNPVDTYGKRYLSRNQHVEYQITQGRRGPEAVRVRVPTVRL